MLTACSTTPNQASFGSTTFNSESNVVHAKATQRVGERLFEVKLSSGELTLVRVPEYIQLSRELQSMPIETGFQTKLVWFIAVPVAIGATGIWLWLTTPTAYAPGP